MHAMEAYHVTQRQKRKIIGSILAMVLFAICLALCLVSSTAEAKPERKTFVGKIEANQELGDVDALLAAIDAATKVDDLKPILKKMLNAQALDTGKKKPKCK